MTKVTNREFFGIGIHTDSKTGQKYLVTDAPETYVWANGNGAQLEQWLDQTLEMDHEGHPVGTYPELPNILLEWRPGEEHLPADVAIGGEYDNEKLQKYNWNGSWPLVDSNGTIIDIVYSGYEHPDIEVLALVDNDFYCYQNDAETLAKRFGYDAKYIEYPPNGESTYTVDGTEYTFQVWSNWSNEVLVAFYTLESGESFGIWTSEADTLPTSQEEAENYIRNLDWAVEDMTYLHDEGYSY